MSDPDVKGLLQSTEFELNSNENSGKCQSIATQFVAILEFEQGWRGTESSWTTDETDPSWEQAPPYCSFSNGNAEVYTLAVSPYLKEHVTIVTDTID